MIVMGKKLLIVDSNACTSESFGRLFGRLGFEVDVAGDASEAKKLIGENQYCSIIVSFNSSCFGIQDFFVYTKQHLPNATAVVLTDYPSLENTVEAIEFGADAAFSKPVDTQLLLKAVEGNFAPGA